MFNMAFIHVHVRVRAMVFNATFNSIIGGGNQSIRGKPVAIHLQIYPIMVYWVLVAMRGIRTRNISGDMH